MNAEPVVIDDDDVDMVELEPVVINDDDNKNAECIQNSSRSVHTIVLDEESIAAPLDNETRSERDRDSSFARLLKNNTLMNKIVKRCLNIENNSGMSRVINKTLMPLYADADNSFKESEQFTALLKKVLNNLKHMPNFKFLHIKSLCEELKAGKYKRKVPFVTLSTDLKRKPVHRSQGKSVKSNKYNLRYAKKKVNNINKKTAIINLDNSDDEPVINLDADDENSDVIVANSEDLGSDDDIVFNNDSTGADDIVAINNDDIIATNNDDIIPPNNDDIKDTNNVDIVSDNDNAHHGDVFATNNDDITATNDDDVIAANNDNHDDIVSSDDVSGDNDIVTKNYGDGNNTIVANDDDVIIVDESTNSDIGSDLSNKENSVSKRENNRTLRSVSKASEPKDTNRVPVTSNDNILLKSTNSIIVNNCKLLDQKDNKKISNTYSQGSSTSNSELLVPKKSVNIKDKHGVQFNRAIAIEKQIAVYKEKIEKLEKEEVTNNCFSSPYILCDKYKAKIVELYKKLCKLTGYGDGNLMKQRVVRLQVIECHPPGPTRRLERFLNSTIDETGNVPLPDFHDVMQCVTDSNIADNLGWNRQEIMREAIALFTQCGHALRKSRQRREYKDLLSLMRDVKEDEPDDHDPANHDPLLLAKLEQNKIIAKANEDEILERFVRMEHYPKNSETVTTRICNVTRINPADDTETDSELDLTPPNKSKTPTILVHSIENKDHETPKEMVIETGPVNSKPVNSSNNLITNGFIKDTKKHEEKMPVCQPIDVSNIQTVIDKIVQNAFNTMKQNAKITSTQTIIVTKNTENSVTHNINIVTPYPTQVTTEISSNHPAQNKLYISVPNLTSCAIRNLTPHNLTNITEQYTTNPTTQYTTNPTTQYTTNPPAQYTTNPTTQYTTNPTTQYTTNPTTQYTTNATTQYTTNPTTQYTTNATTQYTTNPTTQYTTNPTTQYTTNPTTQYTTNPTTQYTTNPPAQYTTNPPAQYTTNPTTQYTTNPTTQYTTNATTQYTTNPTTQYTTNATTQYTTNPTTQYTTNATTQYTTNPTTQYTTNATTQYTTNPTTQYTTNATTQYTTNPTTQYTTNATTQYTTNPTTQYTTNATTHYTKTATTKAPTQYKIDAPALFTTNATTHNEINRNQETEKPKNLQWSDTLQKVGKSNRYVVSFDSNIPQNKIKPPEKKEDTNITDTNLNIQDKEVKVKEEETAVKEEPMDINAMLNALGENYISTIFDIEDPFLVIDISSDSSSDDDL